MAVSVEVFKSVHLQEKRNIHSYRLPNTFLHNTAENVSQFNVELTAEYIT